MTNNMITFITALDAFGQKISFNFNREGDVVKSSVGGTFTIFFKAISLAYLVK
jgi:hypothetical protein